MFQLRGLSSLGVSLVVHILLLGGLWMVRETVLKEQDPIVIDSLLTEEQDYEDYQQEVETNPEPAETVNFVPGGAVTGGVGSAAGPTIRSMKVEVTQDTVSPLAVPAVNPGEVTFFGEDVLGKDLGEGEVSGEIGAAVEGYGAALARMTQELLRLMREKPVHVVWLFDQSDSMKDDQKEIQKNFHTVYEELGLVQRKDEKLRGQKEVLLTSIWAYGEKYSELTSKPTADIEQIRAAIDKIQIDESGLENTLAAVQAVVAKYGRGAARQKQRLVIVIVTDESGDDGQLLDGKMVDKTIADVRQFDAPVYIMGREAVFGYPFAQITWKDPKYGLTHWLRINRGPETEYPEQLQWDGLHGRWDVRSSGFGPYEQVRLAKETGGIFFVLPGEEENLSGAGANEKREFRFLDMKEYQPLLIPRDEYARQRDSSEFRRTIFSVIVQLNPNEYQGLPSHDPQLNIREHWYPVDPQPFREEAAREVVKAARAMSLLNIAIPMLEKIRPLRDSEPSSRWRANYDLILAQCIAYRVRLFQYLLAMDHHANTMPAIPESERDKVNRWNVARTRNMLVPDDAQFQRLKAAFGIKMDKEEYLAYLKAEQDRATGMYHEVIKTHPGTPWAVRAEAELNQGFGMTFVKAFWDPRYEKLDIKLPKP